MCCFSLLLNLTASFDTVDHKIFIDCLRDVVGIEGLALEWFYSYLKDRTYFSQSWDFRFICYPSLVWGPSWLNFGTSFVLPLYAPFGSDL